MSMQLLIPFRPPLDLIQRSRQTRKPTQTVITLPAAPGNGNGSGGHTSIPGHLVQNPAIAIPIPRAASLQIFLEVWSSYSAYAEMDQVDQLTSNFMCDVQNQFKILFPNLNQLHQVLQKLTDNPKAFPATRQALGEAFLQTGVWPVKMYFGKM